MNAHTVLSCLRGAMARWAAGVGTGSASAELGCDPSTVRRKSKGQKAWLDEEIAAAIAHEVDEQGSAEIVTDLVALVCPLPTMQVIDDDAVKRGALTLGAEVSRLAAEIQTRLADGHMSLRDAAEIDSHARATRAELQKVMKLLSDYLKRGGR